MKQYMLPIVVDEDILNELSIYSNDRVLFMNKPQELSKSESEQLKQLNYKMIFKVKIKNVREEEEKMINCETCKNAVQETAYNHDSTKCKRCIGGDENGYELRNSREYILDKAKECVCGHREEDYGVPEQNFQLIADLWNDYLDFNCDENAITCKDVAIMMALLKIARIKRGGGSGDSYVDLAGYAACAGELAARTGL